MDRLLIIFLVVGFVSIIAIVVALVWFFSSLKKSRNSIRNSTPSSFPDPNFENKLDSLMSSLEEKWQEYGNWKSEEDQNDKKGNDDQSN